MTYQDFIELEPGDMIVINRGRFEGRIFEVNYINEDEETVMATWSDMNEAIAPDPIPQIHFGRHAVGVLE